MDTVPAPSDVPTLVRELLSAQDFTAVMVTVQSHADELPKAAEGKRVLEAASLLDSIADRTRTTVQQMLAFLPRLESVVLPKSYEATLAEIDQVAAAAETPAGLIEALRGLRERKVHETVPGFAAGVRAAVDMLTDALQTAHGRALGTSRASTVAKACARGAVTGGMLGALSGTGPIVGAVVVGTAGSARAALGGDE